jgi:outer membrane autotransporter protein
VTLAGLDQLQGRFNANAFSGRVEGGYRFVSSWMGVGVTPYAAGQFTILSLPAYAEQATVGTNNFALAYGAKTVTAPRSELDFRTDQSFALTDMLPGTTLTLRGRFAWAHDYATNSSIAATFQALPGAAFVVNGAAQSADKALTSAGAELKWQNGFSLSGTFEGEFSGDSTSYAGKAVATYQW